MKAAFHNLGCKVNEYETEAMKLLLRRAGYTIVPFEESADVYVVNTCTVTQIADRKSRQMLHRARQKNPSAIVVAAGCYVQEAKEKLLSDEAVDIVVGNNEKNRLPEILKNFLASSGKSRDYVPAIDRERRYEEMSLDRMLDRTRAFVKIQDGCNQFCSYCLIPFARGRVRSRQMADVIREVRTLTANGAREIVLSGIHISSYGIDFDHENPGRTPDFSEGWTNKALLQLIGELDRIEGVRRIRLGSLEPGIMTEDFVRSLAGYRSICPQFHLSLQSGCDETLKRMNRRYRTADFAVACRRLREAFDNPAITTDLIAGFPGETREEFEETLKFVKYIGFAGTHVFKYSRRRRTRAYSLPDQVPETEKNRRSAELIALDEKNRRAFALSYGERRLEVLFEEKEIWQGEKLWKGHSRENLVVYLRSDRNLENVILNCHVVSVDKNGEILAEADEN